MGAEKDLPNNDDDEVENVPCVPKVGARMTDETQRHHFQNAFDRKHNNKQILDLLL